MGSESGLLDVTRRMLLPLALSTGVKVRSLRNAWRSTPALAKSSGEARLGTNSAAVRSLTSSNSISATRGWFSVDFRVNSPSPRACAIPEDSAEAAAIANTSLRT